MTKKEIGEIRRRLTSKKCNATHVRGCFVSEAGNILSEFDQSLAELSMDETDLVLSVIKKVLSGKPAKNLLDIIFSTNAVAYGEKHKLLMGLRDSELKDDDMVSGIFNRIIENTTIQGNYLITLICDTYDVPSKNKNDETDEDAASDVFRYILCSVSPVKTTEPALVYEACDQELKNRHMDQIVKSPEFGFMFPAFDDRATNIYNALCYTRDPSNVHESMIHAIFGEQAPEPADKQKETLYSAMREAMDEHFDFSVVSAFQDQILSREVEHEEEHKGELLTFTRADMERILTDCGASEKEAQTFSEKLAEGFGDDVEISANVLDISKHTDIKADGVLIRIDADMIDKIETKNINGQNYITIKVDSFAEVNGVPLAFN